MTVPPLVAVGAVIPTAPDPVPLVGGVVSPAAKSSAHHVSGVVVGRQAQYSDVQAGAWYVGHTGWEVRNHRGRLSRRPLSGHEDCDEATRR